MIHQRFAYWEKNVEWTCAMNDGTDHFVQHPEEEGLECDGGIINKPEHKMLMKNATVEAHEPGG